MTVGNSNFVGIAGNGGLRGRVWMMPVLTAFLTACGWTPTIDSRQSRPQPVEAEAAVPVVVREPIPTHQFELEPSGGDLVGSVQVVHIRGDETLADLARRFNLGFDELLLANPDIDPWMPPHGAEVILPTRFILPRAPHEGIVINVASLRLYYFPDPADGEPPVVITHPIGIGRLGWATPIGSTTVADKARDPTWYVPASIRREYAEAGAPLAAVIPPGPENPLGEFALTLEMDGYLIHGTNKPSGVGMRVSHGCIRLYPEDMAVLFPEVPRGTPVHIVNQPFLATWHDGELYLEAHAMLEDDTRPWTLVLQSTIDTAMRSLPAGIVDETIDWRRAGSYAREPRGIPLPISVSSRPVQQLMASAQRVENVVPAGANWDGVIEYRMAEEEIEALLEADADGPGAAVGASAVD